MMTTVTLLDLVTDDAATETALADAVSQLLAAHTREDHRLDYKSGEATMRANRNAADLLADVTSFANADGGVLLFGIAEEADGTGAKRPRMPPDGVRDEGDPFIGWIEQVIRRLSPHLSPAPRSRSLTIAGISVVAVAIRRSARLVPCLEKGGTVAYYLRSGDGKFRVPEYLYADLVLGRRERPDLTISLDAKLGASGFKADGGARLCFTATVASAGIVWTPALSVAIVGHCDRRYRGYLALPVEPQPAEGPMLAHVRISRHPEGRSLVHVVPSAPHGALAPLHAIEREFSVVFATPRERTVWRGGIAAIPSNAAPVWAQIDARFEGVPHTIREGYSVPVALTVTLLGEGDAPEVFFGLESAYREGAPP